MELKQKRYELHGHILVFTYNDAGVGMITLDCMDLLVDMAKNVPKRGEWIPCSERLPSSSGKCLVTEGVERKTTSIGYFSAEYKRFYSAMDVIAWMPLPEPYCGADMREREGE